MTEHAENGSSLVCPVCRVVEMIFTFFCCNVCVCTGEGGGRFRSIDPHSISLGRVHFSRVERVKERGRGPDHGPCVMQDTLVAKGAGGIGLLGPECAYTHTHVRVPHAAVVGTCWIHHWHYHCW